MKKFLFILLLFILIASSVSAGESGPWDTTLNRFSAVLFGTTLRVVCGVLLAIVFIWYFLLQSGGGQTAVVLKSVMGIVGALTAVNIVGWLAPNASGFSFVSQGGVGLNWQVMLRYAALSFPVVVVVNGVLLSLVKIGVKREDN